MPSLPEHQVRLLCNNITQMMTMRGYTHLGNTQPDTKQLYMDFTHDTRATMRIVLVLYPCEILLPIDKILHLLAKNWESEFMLITAKVPTVGQIGKIPAGTELRTYDNFKINPFAGPYSAKSDRILKFDDIAGVHYTSISDLPHMRQADSVAIWLGAVPGDVVESYMPTKAVPYRLIYRQVVS